MFFFRIVGAVCISLYASIVYAEGLCSMDESVVFNCELDKTIASLCESKKGSDLVYRAGMTGKLDMKVSSDEPAGGGVFFFSYTPYAGGGEAHIRFSRSAYTYYLYDKTVKSDDGPISSAGIVIYKGGEEISNRVCRNDASIRKIGYESIETETFHAIDAR